ncbi:MAG: RecX family transcriptional regulator [Rhodospirillales bacterium]|nr:RecX family transcriptional regulator [Rhodospirillales bacterium]
MPSSREPSDLTKTRKPRKITAQSLENAALFYVQRFATSAENLRRVLMRRVERSARVHDTDREEGAAIVDGLIDRYRRSGLLDDGGYAEARVGTLHRRGVPTQGIRTRLRQKGVGEDHIETALSKLADEVDDTDLAAAVNLARRRRLGPFRPPAQRADMRDRDLASLGRAGFSWDLARRIVDAESVDDLL